MKTDLHAMKQNLYDMSYTVAVLVEEKMCNKQHWNCFEFLHHPLALKQISAIIYDAYRDGYLNSY